MSRHKLTVSSIFAVIFIGLLLIDSLLSDLSTFVNQSLSEPIRMVLFSALVAFALLFGTQLVLSNTRRIRTELGSKNNVLILISQVMPYIHYAVIALLVIITLQIIFTSQYFTYFMVASAGINWAAAIVFMGLMSFKFIQWYRAKRNSLVLLYLISSALIFSILTLGIIPQTVIMTQTSSFSVNAHSSETKPFQANPLDLSGLYTMLSVVNWLVVPLSFILWGATAFMLRRYSSSLERRKYWIMVSFPLASIIVGVTSFLIFLPSASTVFDQSVILYTMLAFGGILAEGFLLSVAFIKISGAIKRRAQSRISDYLSISARGIAILFVSFFANPSGGSYLPFGIIAVSFLAFGSYLFFFGIYCSAISIAGDLRLRQTIRQSLLDQSKFLDNLGLAQVNREIEKRTTEIIKKHSEVMWKETGIDSPVSDYNVKKYIEEVMGEIQKTKGAK